MKNILLPIDLYSDPQRILKEVLTFLQSADGRFKVFLLKTYTVPASLSDQVINTHDRLKAQTTNALRKELYIAQEFAEDGKISLEGITQMGSPVNVISRTVKEKGIDCVVMEKEDGSKQEEIIRLLNHIQCPMMVLPGSL